eukprot:sb/3464564/
MMGRLSHPTVCSSKCIINSNISLYQVFDAVLAWVKHDLESRRIHLPEILEYIRFGVMSPKLLLDCVVTNPLVSGEPQCKAILDRATAYHLLPERRGEMVKVHSKARTSLPRFLYAVGGENNVGIKLASVERYNVDAGSWEMVESMNIGRSSVGLTSCNGLLYCGGGFGCKAFLNNVECYSPYENEWKEVAPLACARSCLDFYRNQGPRNYNFPGTKAKPPVRSLQPINANSFFFSLVWFGLGHSSGSGIVNSHTAMKSRRKLARQCSECSIVPDHPFGITTKSRLLSLVIAIQSKLYTLLSPLPPGLMLQVFPIIFSADKRLGSVKDRNSVKTGPRINNRYIFSGMVCLDDFVYAIGGRRDDARLSSVERYDCQRDTWVPAGNMSQCRSAAGCTVVDGCIYVAGGYDGFTDRKFARRDLLSLGLFQCLSWIIPFIRVSRSLEKAGFSARIFYGG